MGTVINTYWKVAYTEKPSFNRKRKALLRDTIPIPYPTVMNALNL